MNSFPKIGFRILIAIAVIFTIMLLAGQTMAIINYDLTVSMGLQETVEEVTEVGVAYGKGFGLADTLVYIPLFVLGIAGMLKRTYLGFFCMCGALAITAYWPMVCLAAVYYAKNAPGFGFDTYTEFTILLPLITLYGVWGLVFIYRNRQALVDE